MNFATSLRVEMAKADIGRDELAKLTGISKSCISKYRKGSRKPGWMNIRKIMAALDVPADKFL